MKRGILLFALFSLLLALDFLLKEYVHHAIPLLRAGFVQYPYGGIAIFQGFCGIDFSITHVINKGAAWGILSEWQWLLVYTRVLVVVAMIVYLFASSSARLKQVPLTLIIAGAVGNILDYFIYGHVIDMFLFKFGTYIYPIFNIADSAIFCGIAWLFLRSLRDKGRVAALS